MIRETAYDEVFDAQKHFRSILDSFARPARIQPLDPVALNPPPGLNHASVLVGLALMDADVAFHVIHDEHGERDYLAANTRAVPSPLDKAGFIFAHGADSPEMLESADCGSLTYPDTSATLILEVDEISAEPFAQLRGGAADNNQLRLDVQGPGVDGAVAVFVRGLSADLLLALLARNAEFPMGIDTVLSSVDAAGIPCVVGIPRTARIAWGKL
jgi:alpha-D-ribose 1-methylphosphonate 5-triphosphate synthase subunit PhnH